MLPSSAPYLAATKQIQICSGLDSRERRQEPRCSLRECSLLLLCLEQRPSSRAPPRSPRRLHALHLPFDRSEPGPEARARALLVMGSTERRDRECPSLGSSAHSKCQGMFPQISASWGEAAAGGGNRAREGAKPREPLGGAQGQRLSSLGSSLQDQEAPLPQFHPSATTGCCRAHFI